MRKSLIAIAALISLLVSALALPAAAYAQQEQPQQVEPPAIIQSDLFLRALTAFEAQDYDKVVLDLSLFILLNPTYGRAYYTRAEGYYAMNDLEHALQDVNRAIELAGSTEDAGFNSILYALRGRIDLQQQNLDAAIDDYTQSIDLAPSVEALANRAILYMNRNDFTHALSDFTDAVNLDATDPRLYAYRGQVNAELEDAQAAGSDFLSFFDRIQTNTIDHDAIETGDSIELQVDRGVVYRVPFTAEAGQYASALAVARSNSVDPLMVLLDPNGNALAGDDDGGGNTDALILNYEIPEDGEYTLLIGHSLGGFTGMVNIQVQVSDQPAG